jgi:hypothetical protein
MAVRFPDNYHQDMAYRNIQFSPCRCPLPEWYEDDCCHASVLLQLPTKGSIGRRPDRDGQCWRAQHTQYLYLFALQAIDNHIVFRDNALTRAAQTAARRTFGFVSSRAVLLWISANKL